MDSALRLVAVFVVLVPAAAAACPVCFSADEERRAAFTATAVLLSLAPFALLALLGLLYFYCLRSVNPVRPERSEAESRDPFYRAPLDSGRSALRSG